jgi:hypothetical protein
MKFYKDTINRHYSYWRRIYNRKLTAIHSDESVRFIKNGRYSNSKNAAYIKYNGFKEFSLNGKLYGDENDFTKESWRRFVKLQSFL